MGCNTSKEVTLAAAENTSAAATAPKVEIAVPDQEETVSNNVVEKAKEIATEVVKRIDGSGEFNARFSEQEILNQVAHRYYPSVKENGITRIRTLNPGKKICQNVSDIDLNDPEANRAATKIQAAFRGHQTRKNMKQGDAETKPNLKEEFSPDNKELCEAATKIQASFRGHLVRKSAPRKDEEEELSKELEKLDAKAPDEELDIDLNDPDLQVAATKIQASFRGHRVRKEQQTGENQ